MPGSVGPWPYSHPRGVKTKVDSRELVFCARRLGMQHWDASGKEGVDFATRAAAAGRGLGVFALRSYEKGEVIFAHERAGWRITTGWVEASQQRLSFRG